MSEGSRVGRKGRSIIASPLSDRAVDDKAEDAMAPAAPTPPCTSCSCTSNHIIRSNQKPVSDQISFWIPVSSKAHFMQFLLVTSPYKTPDTIQNPAFCWKAFSSALVYLQACATEFDQSAASAQWSEGLQKLMWGSTFAQCRPGRACFRASGPSSRCRSGRSAANPPAAAPCASAQFPHRPVCDYCRLLIFCQCQ